MALCLLLLFRQGKYLCRNHRRQRRSWLPYCQEHFFLEILLGVWFVQGLFFLTLFEFTGYETCSNEAGSWRVGLMRDSRRGKPVSSFSRHDVQKPFFKNKECLLSLRERGKATFLWAGLVLLQPQLLFCSTMFRFFPWCCKSGRYSDPVENFAPTLHFEDGKSERFAHVILCPWYSLWIQNQSVWHHLLNLVGYIHLSVK